MADNFEVFWYEMRFGKKRKVVKRDLTEQQAKDLRGALEYENKEFKPKVQRQKD